MSFKEGAATPLSPLQARKLADQKRAEADDEAQSPKPRSPRTADQGLAFDSALSTGDWVRTAAPRTRAVSTKPQRH